MRFCFSFITGLSYCINNTYYSNLLRRFLIIMIILWIPDMTK